MTVRCTEQQLGDLRWIVVRGAADEAFRALGTAEATQIREVLTDCPLLWHTNHGRYLPGAEPAPEGTSVARGQTLSALAVPEQEQEQDPDPAWFLRILAEAPLPHGVRRDREPGDPAVTLFRAAGHAQGHTGKLGHSGACVPGPH